MATAGIEVYNPDGTLQFTLASRMYRRLASVNYTAVNGSATFVVKSNDIAKVEVASGFRIPEFQFSGNTVTWAWPAGIPVDQRNGGVLNIMVY